MADLRPDQKQLIQQVINSQHMPSVEVTTVPSTEHLEKRKSSIDLFSCFRQFHFAVC